jgi:hypothetical protein
MHAGSPLTVKGYLFSHRHIAPHVELGRSPEPPISRVVSLRKEWNPSSRAIHHCRVPVEVGFEPNVLELDWVVEKGRLLSII